MTSIFQKLDNLASKPAFSVAEKPLPDPNGRFVRDSPNRLGGGEAHGSGASALRFVFDAPEQGRNCLPCFRPNFTKFCANEFFQKERLVVLVREEILVDVEWLRFAERPVVGVGIFWIVEQTGPVTDSRNAV
jgi:hypothetical protein